MIKSKSEFINSLERFVIAQNPCYSQVIQELKNEQKRSHWMWFVFPQISGLGHSEYAQYYGLNGLADARAFLEHPILGKRYEECLQLLDKAQASAEDIFGPVDAKKLQSSLTIFLEVESESPLLNGLLNKFFNGVTDDATYSLLQR